MIPTQYPLWYGAPAMWQAPPPLPYWGYVPPQPMFAYPAPVGALAAPSLYTSAAALPAQVTYSTASAAVASSSSSAASSEPSAPAPVVKNTKVLALFDVDGTLTAPRLRVEPGMTEFLRQLRRRVVTGVVGGSDFAKVREQLGDDILNEFDYVFAENGVTAYKLGKKIETETLVDYLGEDRLKRFLNFTLRYIADLDIPIKRGTFIEFRQGMLNVSPIGRNCSQAERIAFNEYDAVHGVRKAMKAALEKEFADYGLQVSIGGQISMDVFPVGWDKTYCLRQLRAENFDAIHFFGDKTQAGENDYEIFISPETIGHRVTSPADTERQCRELFWP